MKTIAFFNNKGGVGKTSLVYHLAWMYADLGLTVIAADLDPQADLVLVVVGPSLGAMNRAALLVAEHVVIPLAPDLYSLQGLRNLGPTLRRWRGEWAERREHNPVEGLSIPVGEFHPAGYVVMQHAVRLSRPTKAYERRAARIPAGYREWVLGSGPQDGAPASGVDPYQLGALRPYRSLMPLAQEARKPMFFLRPADGALGGHAKAAQDCYRAFRTLAISIATRCSVTLSTS